MRTEILMRLVKKRDAMKLLAIRPPTRSATVGHLGHAWIAGLIGARMTLMLGLCAGLLWVGSAAPAFADVILTDGNSEVSIDLSSSAGVNSWIVDGVNQLYQEWFWYRVGASGAASSIDTLGAPSITSSTAATGTAVYSGSNGLVVKIDYTLAGGSPNSGAAELSQIVTLSNTGASSLDLHFFQYANFNLLGGSDDSVQFQNKFGVDQGTGLSSEALSETVVTHAPTYREANPVPITLNEFGNNSFTTLSDVNSNTPSSVYGPGDMSWAYEWDDDLSPGGTYQISKDMNLSGLTPVPEPSTFALAFAGLLAIAGFAFRRR
jgi:hypothetical protein